ncbi:codeine O-demethylase-like [Andrographis paniculata]|uniref:codeine O-demethylase-like n=1 Tax=Andrographis paniculata TaxID=175694 RepID=UPI0021E7A64D|nr:codeine O-demethylase-like [Andrographis paniculata]
MVRNCWSSSSIPIFDMKDLLDPESRSIQLHKFHTACKEWGLFQLVNHGMDSEMVEKLKQEIHGFYKLPLQERLKYAVRPGQFEGYGQTKPAGEEGKVVDWGERFYMITNPLSKRQPHLLPNFPPSLRETLETYIQEQQNVARVILGLIAESLGIDGREMEEMFVDGMESVRMNYYPPFPEPEKVVGIVPHSDGSAVTTLLQLNDVEGLQIKKHHNHDDASDNWLPVKFLPGAIVVILGDIIEVISNGIYKSVVHRAVVNREEERLSVATFFNPKLEAEVGPWSSSPSPRLFRTIKSEQYVQEFFSRKLQKKSFLNYMKI